MLPNSDDIYCYHTVMYCYQTVMACCYQAVMACCYQKVMYFLITFHTLLNTHTSNTVVLSAIHMYAIQILVFLFVISVTNLFDKELAFIINSSFTIPVNLQTSLTFDTKLFEPWRQGTAVFRWYSWRVQNAAGLKR